MPQSHLSWLSFVCVVELFACSSTDSSRSMQDAVLSADGGEDDLERKLKSLDLKPRDDAEEEIWKHADKFEISFSASACFGTCPPYEYAVDQDGVLHFEGSQYVARPGTYDTNVSSDAGQFSLVFSAVQHGFLRLNDSYSDAEDGCLVATDNPTYEMRIDLPDRSKAIDYYAGCLFKGPAYDALRDVVSDFQAWIGDRGFTQPKPRDCRRRDETTEWMVDRALRESYVLLDSQGKPASLLRIDPQPQDRFKKRSWHVLTCEGQELFGSEVKSGYGCDAVLLPAEGSMFTWPGVTRPVNAALLERQDTSIASTDVISVHLLDADSEVVLSARAADACQN